MRRRTFLSLTPLLAVAAASASSAPREEASPSSSSSGGVRRRRASHRDSEEDRGEELVSLEPLVFESPEEEEPVERQEGSDPWSWDGFEEEDESHEDWYDEEASDDEASDGDYDSTYVPDEEGQFVLSEEEGAVGSVGGPIQSRLRRLGDPLAPAREGADEERYLAEKARFDDESRPVFEPALDENGEFEIVPEPAYLEELAAEAEGHDYHGRALQNQNGCAANQVRARVVVRTDNTGWENSWAVRRSNNALVAKGPRGQTKYGSNQSYAGGICLGPGTYKFTVRDSFRDGMCGGSTGKGYYRFFLDGVQRFTSPASCSDNWSVRTHTFTVQPRTIDLGGGDNAAQIASAGRGGCSNVKIQFQVDKFGKETVVKLVGNGVTHLISNKEVASYGSKTMEKCVPPGTYKFTLTDQDGLCCKYGKGYYKLFEGGELLVQGGFFVGSKTYTIQVGKNWRSDMSARDLEWLAAHNKKRKKYNGGAGFRPMRWSTSLARNAENYAAQIGKTCSALIHAKGVSNGENLARNTGTGGFSQKYSADAIMSRWVDRELTWPYPKNAHYLQVVWRSSLYVGCGEHVSDRGGGALCRTQVCRYVRAGNCQVMNGNWQSEAWKDDTRCGDPCPQEGCYKY